MAARAGPIDAAWVMLNCKARYVSDGLWLAVGNPSVQPRQQVAFAYSIESKELPEVQDKKETIETVRFVMVVSSPGPEAKKWKEKKADSKTASEFIQKMSLEFCKNSIGDSELQKLCEVPSAYTTLDEASKKKPTQCVQWNNGCVPKDNKELNKEDAITMQRCHQYKCKMFELTDCVLKKEDQFGLSSNLDPRDKLTDSDYVKAAVNLACPDPQKKSDVLKFLKKTAKLWSPKPLKI